jgi:ABC-type sugar transport system ATPase subunit
VGDGVDVGGGLVIPMPPDARAKAGEQVTVGVRPEHFVAGAGSGPVFNLHVDTVESLGADSLLHAGFNGTLLVVRIEGHSTPKAGTALDVSILPGKAYFFDTATGKRLTA